jgi:hypothetical protein
VTGMTDPIEWVRRDGAWVPVAECCAGAPDHAAFVAVVRAMVGPAKTAPAPAAPPSGLVVTRTGLSYHRPECPNVRGKRTRPLGALTTTVAQYGVVQVVALSPCGQCRPPEVSA